MIQRIIIFLCAILPLIPIQELMASEVGDVSPNCKIMPGSDNEHYELQKLRGNVVYVDFWASWCGPCAKSFPFLNNLDHEFRDRGLKIVGVNMDEKPEDMKEFIAQYPANFTIALPPNEQCALDFGVKAMPSSYIIDRKGSIRLVHLGFRAGEAEELRKLITQLLAEKAE
ncbi:MAG: TlpA family protein disulfide reductase [Methylococcaceae bacterium]